MENFKFKTVDFIILAGVILALVVGFFTYKNFRQTASKQIEATSKIYFDVFIRGITYTGDKLPVKSGDSTFIPYSNLDIVAVKAEKRKVVLPRIMSSSKIDVNKPVLVVDDPSQAHVYDILVSLTDTAKITKDGAVVGGNKIKIGLPITLEGKDYKFNGTVSNLQVSADSEIMNHSDDIQ
uniref:DUF4330 domain-containing protein n=1 Tax=Candidatus Scatousia sp. TaxID=3085663 RepID=UPI004024F56F